MEKIPQHEPDEYPFSHAEHLALLKQAIAANLRARIEYDEWRDSQATGPIKLELINAADLMRTSRDKLRLEEAIANPVRSALRSQLRDLGKRLFRLLGTTDAMLMVAEEVADMAPGSPDRRINIIDKTWDGIGDKHDFWVA